MKQFSYVLTRPIQPRARQMSDLLREIARFHSSVNLRSGEKSAAVRKLRDVSGLNLRGGSSITVTVEGRDEEAAVAAIQNCVVAQF